MTDVTDLSADQALIARWIKPGTRVIDLGCGDGVLLAFLQETLDVSGYGLEIDPDNVVSCVTRGVNVIQTDIEAGLLHFDRDAFDYVIMTQTIQATRYPDRLLAEILRIGREGIVTFPNMGNWKARLQFLAGRMPVTRYLPDEWYNTPNLHLCSFRDFDSLCENMKIEVLQRAAVDYAHRADISMRFLPNLLGEVALYRVRQSTAPQR